MTKKQWGRSRRGRGSRRQSALTAEGERGDEVAVSVDTKGEREERSQRG
jgi:hypothetical protein